MLSLKQITMLVVSITLFMDVMDGNVLNTAVPTMANSFQVNPVDLKVALISYLLSIAIFTPASGWVADYFGAKKIYIGGLIIFVLSSFFCGFATNVPSIVIGRFIQGIGAAFMIALGRLMLARVFPRNELIETMSKVVMIISVAVMLGPAVGGVIVQHWSWPWIFWINVPIGIALITLSIIFLKDNTEHVKHPFDTIGFILFSGGLSLLCFSLSEMSESRADIGLAIFNFTIAFLLLIAYVYYAKKIAFPIIQIALFQKRTFWISVFGNTFARLGFGGIPFLLPLMQQVCFGFSPQLSGFLLMPIAIGIICAKSFATSFLRKLGYRRYLLINTVIISFLLCLFALTTAQTHLWVIALLTFLLGVFLSAQFTGMNSLAFADIEDHQLSASTSITTTTQIIGQSLGVAVGALLLRFFSALDTHHFTLTVHLFHQTFVVLSVITLMSSIVFIRLHKQDGTVMLTRGHIH